MVSEQITTEPSELRPGDFFWIKKNSNVRYLLIAICPSSENNVDIHRWDDSDYLSDGMTITFLRDDGSIGHVYRKRASSTSQICYLRI